MVVDPRVALRLHAARKVDAACRGGGSTGSKVAAGCCRRQLGPARRCGQAQAQAAAARGTGPRRRVLLWREHGGGRCQGSPAAGCLPRQALAWALRDVKEAVGGQLVHHVVQKGDLRDGRGVMLLRDGRDELLLPGAWFTLDAGWRADRRRLVAPKSAPPQTTPPGPPARPATHLRLGVALAGAVQVDGHLDARLLGLPRHRGHACCAARGAGVSRGRSWRRVRHRGQHQAAA